MRKKPAHWALHEHDNRSILIFVTVCTHQRKCILAHPDAVAAILKAWKAADNWMIGRYVIMPDHLHFFCAPAKQSTPALPRWIAFWKSHASNHWPRPEEHPVWQTDFWDTQLRRGDSYDAKWEYVRGNPVRHGKVTLADEWPWQGEMNRLDWHD
jgi:REP element-mobilizing transposase RayT